MEILKYGAIVILSLSALVILAFAFKSGRPIRTLLLNAFLAVAALAVIDLTSKFTGVHIQVNEWTGIGTAVLGVPALCGFLILQIIFK